MASAEWLTKPHADLVRETVRAQSGRSDDSPKISDDAVRELTAPVSVARIMGRGEPVPLAVDVEHTGDRGPAPSSALLRAHAAVDSLPPGMLAMAAWMLSELPGLEAKCRAIKEEGREPVYQPDGSMTPNNWKPTPRPVGALGALLGAVRAWRAAFDPRGGGE